MKPLRTLITKNNLNKFRTSYMEFSKENIERGTVVMFGDQTLGVYVDNDLAKACKIWEKFDLGDYEVENGFFLSFMKYTLKPCYLDIDVMTYDLQEITSDPNCKVIRIYDKKLKSNDVKQLDVKNLINKLNDFVKSSSYISRK